MEWQIVKVKPTSGKNVPFVSIGRGQISFNAAACDLVNDDGNYCYAQLLTGKENGKTVVGVKFFNEPEPGAIPIKRPKNNGKVVKGMTIANKGIIIDLFGKDGRNEGMKRYEVKLVKEYNNMLQILDY